MNDKSSATASTDSHRQAPEDIAELHVLDRGACTDSGSEPCGPPVKPDKAAKLDNR